MRVTIENTPKIITLEGPHGEMAARVWEGTTESGIPVVCFVTRVLVQEGQPVEVYEKFARELKETAKATSRAAEAIPLRLIL